MAGKNITWIAASTTRASIHKSMCRQENLADVTGKAVSQSIAASLLGTALGIGVSSSLAVIAPAAAAAAVATTSASAGGSAAVVAVAAAGPAPWAVLAAMAPLACAHWFLCYKSLCTRSKVVPQKCSLFFFFHRQTFFPTPMLLAGIVSLSTLNAQRFEKFALSFLAHIDQSSSRPPSSAHSLTPEAMSEREIFMSVRGYQSPLKVGVCTDAPINRSFPNGEGDLGRVLSSFGLTPGAKTVAADACWKHFLTLAPDGQVALVWVRAQPFHSIFSLVLRFIVFISPPLRILIQKYASFVGSISPPVPCRSTFCAAFFTLFSFGEQSIGVRLAFCGVFNSIAFENCMFITMHPMIHH
jgi:hypothetical protein